MKETLEDAKQRILDSNYMTLNDADIFEMGAKWQSENMPIHILDVDNTIVQIKDGVVIVEKNDKSKISYTEEEVIAFAKWMYDYKADINKVEEWLEQFKKK